MYTGRIYNVSNFPYYVISKTECQQRKVGNPKSRVKKAYKDLVCAFDIETSAISEIRQSVMYIWQVYIDEIGAVTGRTWNDFLSFINRICDQLMSGEWLIFFVHNLSYEFQFLRGIYNFDQKEVFAVKSRKVLKCCMFDHIEFRCSYLQSNMSLEHFTKSMGVQHEKLTGYDYSKVRYFDTPLTDFELSYCLHDVVGLVEAMKNRIAHGGDNLYTVPLTSTGYARRDSKRAFRQVPYNIMHGQLPNWEIYTYLKRAFRGGNTHASRFYVGVVLNDVKSVDRASSYPDVLVNRQFPVSKFYESEDRSLTALRSLMEIRQRAILMEVTFTDLKLKPGNGCPYLPISKCDVSRDRINDNGRILSASRCVTVITDIDYRIIRDMYEWSDMQITRLYHARYGRLPKVFRDLVIDYFHRKTELKGVPGSEMDYRHSKELINSLYGMFAQDPAKALVIFSNDDFIEDPDKDGPERLHDYYKRAFAPYTYGVWCTAWARYELQLMINIAGSGFVYTDTDSVKFVGNADFSDYNKEVRLRSEKNGGYAVDPSGQTHYLGVAEDEGVYTEFKTLGAKKYVCRREGGPLEITIAGVSKTLGGEELENAGGIAAFDDGFTFRVAGGLAAVYNDKPEIIYYERPDGVQIPITANVYLEPSTYTLGLTDEYRWLLTFGFL